MQQGIDDEEYSQNDSVTGVADKTPAAGGHDDADQAKPVNSIVVNHVNHGSKQSLLMQTLNTNHKPISQGWLARKVRCENIAENMRIEFAMTE